MIQLTAIIAGQPCTMLTGETIEGAEQSCRDRFGARFEGFAKVSLEIRARSAWSRYRAKQMSRKELEDWLGRQGENEKAIREIFNRQIQTKL